MGNFTGITSIQSHQNCRPDYCVKRNVVLAHEVDVSRANAFIGDLPPVLPSIVSLGMTGWCCVSLGPNSRTCVVPLYGFEPDIDPF